jgi:hypothetical protein
MSKQRLLAVALVLTSLAAMPGCHSSIDEPPAVPPAEPAMKPASGEHREPSLEARRLRTAVTALSHSPRDPSFRSEIAALEALAECVESLSASKIAGGRIRAAAGRLAASQATDADRVDAVKDALATAGSVLTVSALGTGRKDHESTSTLLEAAIGRLDRHSSVLEQRGRVLAALRAATNLVYRAQSASKPYPAAGEALRDWEEPGTFCAAVDEARRRVRSLATVSSHEARASAADALLAIADVMALDSQTASRTEDVAKVRLEAFALRNQRSFKGAQGIKSALSRATDVFASSWTDPTLEPWIRAARRSVDAVTGGFVVFERAAIQDAVRTVLDIIVAHAGATGACPVQRERPPPDASD